jgi:hypothetical protein
MKFKQSQNEVRWNLKPTPKNKGDRTRVQHKKGGDLQRQRSLASLGDEDDMRMNNNNMFQEAA